MHRVLLPLVAVLAIATPAVAADRGDDGYRHDGRYGHAAEMRGGDRGERGDRGYGSDRGFYRPEREDGYTPRGEPYRCNEDVAVGGWDRSYRGDGYGYGYGHRSGYGGRDDGFGVRIGLPPLPLLARLPERILTAPFRILDHILR